MSYIQHGMQHPKGVYDDGVNGAAPRLFWDTVAPDGDASPWKEAAIGSLYARKLASSVAIYIKRAAADADADWAIVAMSTALLTQAEMDVLDGAVAGTQAASKAVIPNADVNIGVVKATALHIGATGSETEVTSTPAELNFLDGATAGTQVASKAVIANADVNIGVVKATELHIGTSGSETKVNATPAEIDAAADISAQAAIAANGATLAVVAATHAGKVIQFGALTGTIVTLPAATGTGHIYRFVIGVTATSNANIIKVANATDVMDGSINVQQDTDVDGTSKVYRADAGDDTMTFAGAAGTGGIVGGYIECVDYKSGFWSCRAFTQSGGGAEVTPFSATV